MFTPEERRQLRELGYGCLRNLAAITTSTALYGTFTLLFTLSIFIVVQRRVNTCARSILLSTTILSFFLASAHWATLIAGSVVYLQKAFIFGMVGLLDGTWVSTTDRHVFVLNQIANWTVPFLLILNDSIVTWRAWALCIGCRRLMILPLLLLLGTYSTAFTFLGLTTTAKPLSIDISGLLYAIGALSLATNAGSTLVISYRLWICRKAWNVGLDDRWSHAQKILLTMVESGALYLTLQLMTISLFNKNITPHTPLSYFAAVLWTGYVQTTAMYPTLVLLLIEHQLSFTDMHRLTPTSLRQKSPIYSTVQERRYGSSSLVAMGDVSSEAPLAGIVS